LRIDPRIKYGIDLAARIQKRTVTGVVEWAVERALADVHMPPDVFREHQVPDAPTDLASHLDDMLWSTNEGVRLVLLASRFPSLLTYDETLIWETVKLSPPFWRVLPASPEECTPWENARLDVIAEHWDKVLKLVAERKELSAISYRDIGLSESYGSAMESIASFTARVKEMSDKLVLARQKGESMLNEEDRRRHLAWVESMQKTFDELFGDIEDTK